jgi:hypothetical protein
MAESVLFVDLGIGATNEQIIDQMRIMKRGREEGLYRNIVCTIRGFDDDPRELVEIIEVRAFCHRIVSLGFISYLDISTIFDDQTPLLARKGWGAAEVWLCSEGRLRPNTPLTRELLDELQQAVEESNERADTALGPMG